MSDEKIKVKRLSGCKHDGKEYGVNDVLEVDPALAKKWIDGGNAEAVNGEAVLISDPHKEELEELKLKMGSLYKEYEELEFKNIELRKELDELKIEHEGVVEKNTDLEIQAEKDRTKISELEKQLAEANKSKKGKG